MSGQSVVRLVLDANAVVSSRIRPSGPPGQLLAALMADARVALVANETILAEYARALAYPKVMRYTHQTPADIDRFVGAIGLMAEIVDGPLPGVHGCEDPDDLVYLQVALAGQAAFVVSGDKHLLTMDPYETVRIVTPAHMLQFLFGRSVR